MKIKKIAQGAYSEQGLKNSNIIRFDKNARVEIFIEQWEIETNNQWSTIVSRKDISDEQKITMLKDVCVEIAYEKLRLLDAGSGIQISIGGMSPKDINIDRINWQQILDPDRGL